MYISNKDASPRLIEGLILLAMLPVGVLALQEILPAHRWMQVALLSVYTLKCTLSMITLSSVPAKPANTTMPQYQFEHERELERAVKKKRPPLFDSPESYFKLRSRTYLVSLGMDMLLLGLIVLQVLTSDDQLLQVLGLAYGAFRLASALEMIHGYAYKAPLLWLQPDRIITKARRRISICSCVVGLLYCIYTSSVMLGMV